MKKRVCMIMTDAISFNVLCRGQLEFFRDNYGVDITLVCGGLDSERNILERRNVGRVVHVPFRRKPSLFADLVCLFRLLIFFIFNRFDIVVYSTPKAMLLSSMASFLSLHRKRIAIVRGRAYEGFSGKKRRFYVLLDKIIFLLSTSVLSISESLRASYRRDGLSVSGMVVLGSGSSNGVDVFRFRPSEFTKSEGSTFQVGIVGRVCQDKGIKQIEEVVNIVKKGNPEIDFVLVGAIEDDVGEEVVNRLTANQSVRYFPHKDDIHNHFREFDIHLFLTHREGFGNVALEAASCMVPTFAFDVVGVRDSVNHNVSGLLFDFLDSKEVADAVLDAANNPDGFRRRFSGARDWAVDNFEQKSVWKMYFDFFVD